MRQQGQYYAEGSKSSASTWRKSQYCSAYLYYNFLKRFYYWDYFEILCTLKTIWIAIKCEQERGTTICKSMTLKRSCALFSYGILGLNEN